MDTEELLNVVNDSDSDSDSESEEVIGRSGGRDNNGEYYWEKVDCLWVKKYYPHVTLDTDSHGVKRKNSIEENTQYSIKKKDAHKEEIKHGYDSEDTISEGWPKNQPMCRKTTGSHVPSNINL